MWTPWLIGRWRPRRGSRAIGHCTAASKNSTSQGGFGRKSAEIYDKIWRPNTFLLQLPDSSQSPGARGFDIDWGKFVSFECDEQTGDSIYILRQVIIIFIPFF